MIGTRATTSCKTGEIVNKNMLTHPNKVEWVKNKINLPEWLEEVWYQTCNSQEWQNTEKNNSGQRGQVKNCL
jgi:hypothetical protein